MMSLTGVVPAVVGVPILMRSWAPTWATVLWVAAYVAMSVVAWIQLFRGSTRVEGWWSTLIGLIFGLLPISAHLFDPGTRSVWIASFVCIIVISFEVSTLPYLANFEWRTGSAINGGLVTGVAFFEIGLVAFFMVPVLMAILRNGDELRAKKTELEQSFQSAARASERSLAIARNDALTGVLNRRGLVNEIERMAVAGDYVLLMVDADRFKAVNDTHGHAAGDEVIRSIADALRARLPEPWTLGRLGGDEFVAVAPAGNPVPVGVCDAVHSSVSLFGSVSHLTVGVSGGYAVSEGDEGVDRLISKAGYAMRTAKGLGGGLLAFDHEMDARFDRMLEVNGGSGAELDTDAFLAEFQPIVDVDGGIVGAEALCRWRRSDGTILGPDQFLPLLAESGRMPQLNETMLRRGLAFAARFNDLPDAPFVSVNIGSAHFANDGLLPLLTGLLEEYAVPPARLMIEITENDLLGHSDGWHGTAVRLLGLGVKLAIDDFGSGYSNLDRLNSLPVSHLKFDRSLTTAVEGSLRSVVQGVVEFADESAIGIIAEGIETDADFEAMCNIGVRHFQGYRFSRPDTPDAIEAAVRNARGPGPLPVEVADAASDR